MHFPQEYDKTGNIISQKEGKIQFKGDKVYIKNFNLLYGELPLSIDGYIQTNDTVNPEFNIYTSFELTDELCDKIVNPHIKYPLSLSGNGRVIWLYCMKRRGGCQWQ